MPTPSSNAPDPQPPRSHPFSCPDPADPSQADGASQAEHHPPPSPSSWRPNPPLAYSDDAGRTAVAPPTAVEQDDLRRSQSVTLSPQTIPSSPGDQATRPESMDTSRESSEDSQKPSDLDEEMVGGGAQGTTTRAGTGGGVADAQGTSSRAKAAGEPDRGPRDPDLASPLPPEEGTDHWDVFNDAPRWMEDSGLAGMGYEYSNTRVIPILPSSYLRPGSRFTGTQQSERQRYDVQVEIKNVDLRESFLCGYLRIQGLTEDHPTLTTYFEGEIIGPKYGFVTQHPTWGATEKIDLSHWSKFNAFRPHAKQARKGGRVIMKDIRESENVFMRWKEHFLVPDHRLRTINGASFEGFYYICFNQLKGEVSGIYFHSKSEKFQQLELKHIDDKGCFGALEFR